MKRKGHPLKTKQMGENERRNGHRIQTKKVGERIRGERDVDLKLSR